MHQGDNQPSDRQLRNLRHPLDCNAVQLKENIATTFIATLPPVVFEGGFIVTITDTEENTYRIESSQRNEIKRSALLVMPEKELDSSVKYSIS